MGRSGPGAYAHALGGMPTGAREHHPCQGRPKCLHIRSTELVVLTSVAPGTTDRLTVWVEGPPTFVWDEPKEGMFTRDEEL